MDGQVVGLVVSDDQAAVDSEELRRSLPSQLHLLFSAGATFDHIAAAPIEGGGPVLIEAVPGAGKTGRMPVEVKKLLDSQFVLMLFSSAQSYKAAVHRFEDVLSAIAPTGVPQPAWFAQAQRNASARDEFLKKFGALDSEDVAELAGSQAENRRATAHRWLETGRIFSVSHLGKVFFPGFQFEPDTGQPRPVVRSVLEALPLSLQGWQRALWWATPSDLLEWKSPVELLDESPEKIVVAASAEADEWRAAAGE